MALDPPADHGERYLGRDRLEDCTVRSTGSRTSHCRVRPTQRARSGQLRSLDYPPTVSPGKPRKDYFNGHNRGQTGS
jgi:hypothetical protein